MNIIATITNSNSAYAYIIEVSQGAYIEVHANSRAQASKIARNAGYAVRSVSVG